LSNRAGSRQGLADQDVDRLTPEVKKSSREPGSPVHVLDFLQQSSPHPLADPAEAKHEYGVELVALEHFTRLDGLVLAVPHRVLGEGGWDKLFAALAPGGMFVDVKSVVTRDRVPQGTHYWSL
jgi:hypothetical protein